MSKTLLLASIAASLVAMPALAADAAAGKAKYEALCASCHGAAGKGDGPASASLNPKPRNFTDKAWQAKTSDEHIKKIILGGGPAVGMSPLMPPMGAALSEADLANVIAYIRSLGK